MKIVKLTAENVKRLTAIEINPEGNVITIGGKNGAGKSSVLDSISYALGGQKLIPNEPIHTNKNEAKIEVELDDFIVTRKFTRTDEGTKSSLTIRSKEGLQYSSPQAVLDKLLGKLSFDPLAFSNATPMLQREILSKLVDLDTTEVDQKINITYAKRSETNKHLKMAESQFLSCPKHPDVGYEEVDFSTISKQMLEAEKIRVRVNEITKDVLYQSDILAEASARMRGLEETIKEHQRYIKSAEEAIRLNEIKKFEAENKRIELQKEQERIAKNLPNTEELTKKIGEIQEINKKVKQNQTSKNFEESYEALKKISAEQSLEIENLRQQKKDMISNVTYPIEGLAVADEGVTFRGIPLDQTSTAEKLRISVAIGLALNPTLKILLLRDGSSLDSTSLADIASQAEKADAQIWLERVAETKDGISVMIEEGSVV